MRTFGKLALASVSLLSFATPAYAQPAQQAQPAPQDGAPPTTTEEDKEIIVTGTSIRGVAPPGAEVLQLDETEVRATGAFSATQVLATLPQLSDFGEVPTIQGSNGVNMAVNRPNLRNLPGGVSSTAATLILMDGHRLPGAGVLQTFADPDIIPPSVLRRVEIVPDGGSAIYGADAVGGVINFITRRDFDGLQLDYRHGFGKDFSTDDASITAGKKWDGGSAYISYAYAHRDPLYAIDRDYVRNINWATGVAQGINCVTPNRTVGGAPVGTTVFCDNSRQQFSTLFGEETRNSVFGGGMLDLTDSLTVDLRGWYTERRTRSDGGGRIATVLTPPITSAATQARALFNFSPFDPHSYATSRLSTFGFSPSVTWDIGSRWQARAFLNYGHSNAQTHSPATDNTLLQTYVTAGTIDPFNIAAPANASRVTEVLTRLESFGRGIDRIWNARAVVDGPLFTLPGGDVRIAAGVEFLHEKFSVATNANRVVGAPVAPARDKRRAMGYFGELNIPIVGSNNPLPLIHSLSLSAAARLDDYSDFGSVTTPRLGVTWGVTNWIKLRGTWSKAFQAPGLADTARAGSTYAAFTSIPSTVLIKPGENPPIPNTWNFLSVNGAVQNLQPQRAKIWTLGIDVSPPIIPGLDFGISYYHIDYRGRITSPLGSISTLFTDFPGLVIRLPDAKQLADFAAAEPGAATALATLAQDGDPLYLILDARNRNLGNELIEGLDFKASYSRSTSFGSVFANMNANYMLDYRSSPSPTAPLSANKTNTDNNTEFSVSGTLGINIGEHWLAQATINHVKGVKLAAPTGLSTATTDDDQSRLKNHDLVNLFVQYEVKGTGLLQDLRFTLGINNLFDKDPPIYKGTWPGGFSQTGFALTSTGRVIQLGVSKKF